MKEFRLDQDEVRKKGRRCYCRVFATGFCLHNLVQCDLGPSPSPTISSLWVFSASFAPFKYIMPVYERNSKPYARSNDFYKPKDHVLGHSSRQTQPAWKAANGVGGSPQGSWKGKAVENGSKVFLTGLPADVAEKDVEVRACL